jgi:hypothetical protein
LGGRAQGTCAALEEGHAEGSFEVLDLAADRAMGDVELVAVMVMLAWRTVASKGSRVLSGGRSGQRMRELYSHQL